MKNYKQDFIMGFISTGLGFLVGLAVASCDLGPEPLPTPCPPCPECVVTKKDYKRTKQEARDFILKKLN